MAKADQGLAPIDFEITFVIDEVMPRVTGSKFEGKEDNDLFGNKKIVSVGISDYILRIKKERKELSINAGGINLRTHFRFSHIY